jgi:hypothetical protein
MTTDALCGEPLAIKWSDGPYLVARIAVDGGVGANQRKAVLVLTDVVDRNLPTSIPMADVTLRTVFPTMNVGMAVLALLADVCENKIGVAVLARYLGVHSAQGKPSFAMFEFRDSADRRPSNGSVAILAGDVQRAVRTPANVLGGGIACIARRQTCLKEKSQLKQQEHFRQNRLSPTS